MYIYTYISRIKFTANYARKCINTALHTFKRSSFYEGHPGVDIYVKQWGIYGMKLISDGQSIMSRKKHE